MPKVKNPQVFSPLDDRTALLDCLGQEVCFWKASLIRGQSQNHSGVVVPILGCAQRYHRFFYREC